MLVVCKAGYKNVPVLPKLVGQLLKPVALQQAMDAFFVPVGDIHVLGETVDDPDSELDRDGKAFAWSMQVLPEVWRQKDSLRSVVTRE
jgi:hypothetical protein